MDTVIFFISTKIMNSFVFVLTILFIISHLFLRKEFKKAVIVLFGLAVNSILIILLKELFQVARPTGARLELTSYAFPSGHAASIAFLSCIVFYYITHIYEYSKKTTSVVLLSVSLLVGASRLYLGVHTVGEVVGGYFIGLLIGSLTYRILLDKENG